MTNDDFSCMTLGGYSTFNKLQSHVLLRALEFEPGIMAVLEQWGRDPSPETLQAAYDAAQEKFSDTMQEAKNECRGGTQETGLPVKAGNPRLFRDYEATSVASKMPDGTWVGWTYWHGGGRHGEPSAIEWMEDAYDLAVKEEERVIVVRTFTRPQ